MGLLHLLDRSLEKYLRAAVPLDPREVDVAFEAPDTEWSAKITRPTVNLFLYDVRRSSTHARAGFEVTEVDGTLLRRQVAPRVEFRYLVTAWTADHRDEHQLLGALLVSLLASRELPREHLEGSLAAGTDLPILEMASSSGRDQVDLWKALDGQLKPGLELIATVPVDVRAPVELPAPPDEVGVSVGDRERPSRRSERTRPAAGSDGS
ncbi:MAG TPA: DUF4255 domain-containing protein [Acidimicrobiales bacterium]|nr:DUF4255 domain-containing protein [Acidimicrobiales bacterium]